VAGNGSGRLPWGHEGVPLKGPVAKGAGRRAAEAPRTGRGLFHGGNFGTEAPPGDPGRRMAWVAVPVAAPIFRGAAGRTCSRAVRMFRGKNAVFHCRASKIRGGSSRYLLRVGGKGRCRITRGFSGGFVWAGRGFRGRPTVGRQKFLRGRGLGKGGACRRGRGKKKQKTGATDQLLRSSAAWGSKTAS